MADPFIGGTLGEYTVLEELGRGGMAVVYKAKDEKLDRVVALKVLNRQACSDPKATQRFETEARLTSRLNHPNIVSIYGIGREDGLVYFAMEYMPHSSLHEIIKQKGKFSVGEAIRIVKEVLKGLQCAHQAGIVHRDIKPENIMMNEQGHVVLVDFGIAKTKKGARLTQTGILLGTPYYMSPEQITGKEVKFTSDIYSLGVVLFELLTAEVPFQADSTFMITYKHCTQAPPDPRDFNKDVSDELRRVILKALEKDPAKRYQSAGEMLTDIECVERGEEVQAQEPTEVDISSHPDFAKAIACYNAGDLEKAVSHFEAVTKDAVPPEYAAQAQRWIGSCYYDMKLFPAAVVEFKKVVDTWPETEEAMRIPVYIDGCCFQQLSLGESLYSEGKREKALEMFTSILETLRNEEIPLDNNLWSQHAESKVEQIEREIQFRKKIRIFSIVSLSAFVTSAVLLFVYLWFIDPFAYYSVLAHAYGRGGFFEAEQSTLESALKLKPKDARTIFRLARAMSYGGASRQACIKKLEQALLYDDRLAEAHELLGELEAENGGLEKAEGHLRRALALAGPSARLCTNLGYVVESRGRPDEALALYRKALEIDPGYAMAFNNIGVHHLNNKNYELAEKALRQAIRCREDLAAAHHNLAKTLYSEALAEEQKGAGADRKKTDDLMKKAYEGFSTAILLDPDLADAYYHRALIANRRGEYETARQSMKRALALDEKDARLNYEYAQMMLRDEDISAAVQYLERAVKWAPDEPSYRLALVKLYKRVRMWDRAQEIYDSLIKLLPSNADLYKQKAVCQKKRRLFGEAGKTLAIAIKMAGPRHDLLAELGEILHLQKREKEAGMLLSKAVQAQPENGRYRFLLAETLLSQGAYSEAVEQFRQAGRLKYSAADALYKQGCCLIKLGRFRAAQDVLRRALLQKRDHLDAMNELGVLLGRLGGRKEAVKLLTRSLELDPLQPRAARVRQALEEFSAGDR